MTLQTMMNQERVLAFGGQGTGKSESIVHLVYDLAEQGHRAIILDRGNGLAKAFKEVAKVRGPMPEKSFDYFLMDTWEQAESAIALAMAPPDEGGLGPNDWFVFDEAGKMWDFAQTVYTQRVFGDSMAEYTITARAAAEAKVKAAKLEDDSKEARVERQKGVMYSGMDGQLDWPYIKRLHNDEVFDRVIVDGMFNVATFTGSTWSDNDEKSAHWKMFKNLETRPTGEKNQIFRHDTIAYLERKGGAFTWRTDMGAGTGKDRGYAFAKDELFTEIGFIASLKDSHEKQDAAA